MDWAQKIADWTGFEQAPETIRHELLEMQYLHLRRTLPYLYMTLIFGVISCSFALSDETSIMFRYVLPIVVGTLSAWRIFWWMRNRHQPFDPVKAKILIPRTAILSALIGTICGAWSVFAWMTELSDFRFYIPAFMALGAFSTAYCISMAPKVATYAVSSGIVPISVMLISSDIWIDIALGLTMLVSTLFLVALIRRQFSQIIRMLELQHQMHQMAHTDSLTGLMNRRAMHDLLDDSLAEVSIEQPVTLALLDLDGFKPVNDTYGHDVGDTLLQQLAQRMAQQLKETASVARLGGDEFAILFAGKAPGRCEKAIAGLAARLTQPYHIDGQSITIGISYGFQHVGDDETPVTTKECMIRADKKLYAMKSGRASSRSELLAKAV